MRIGLQEVVRRLKIKSIQLARVIRNAVVDLRGGSLLIGSVPSRYRHLGAVSTVSTDYGPLRKIFSGRIAPDSVVVDVGCGKGRVIQYLLGKGDANRIIGLELDADIAEKTRRRFARHGNVTIVAGDAIANLPASGSIFYLYNPFDAANVARFSRRLCEMFDLQSGVTVLYYNCKHVEVFANDDWVVESVDLGGPPELPYDRFAVIRMAPPRQGGN